MTNNHIVAFFAGPIEAAKAATFISQKFVDYNHKRSPINQLHTQIQLLEHNVKIINNELLEPPIFRFIPYDTLPLSHLILTGDQNMQQINKNYIANKIPELILLLIFPFLFPLYIAHIFPII